MKKHVEITWFSSDGLPWANPEFCAKHEIETVQGLKEKMCIAFESAHHQAQLNWCGGNPEERTYCGPCACMGCINHTARANDLTYFHWKYWIDNLRKPNVMDGKDDSKPILKVMVTVKEGNHTPIVQLMRKEGATLEAAKQFMAAVRSGQPAVFAEKIPYYYAERYINLLKELKVDATYEIALM